MMKESITRIVAGVVWMLALRAAVVARMGRVRKSASLLVAGVLLVATVSLPVQSSTIWEIGSCDSNGTEFACAATGYKSLRTDDLFIVGKSEPAKQWPYALPGAVDTWAPAAQRINTILFQLETVSSDGQGELIIDLADTHNTAPSLLLVRVNGHLTEQRLPKGAGTGISRPSEGKACRVAVPVLSKQLRPGHNRIEITSRDGSWMVYDAVRLLMPETTRAAKDFSGIVSVQAKTIRGEGLVEKEGKKWQPLQFVLRHIGADQNVLVRCGEASTTVRVKEGENTARMLIPAVEKEQEATLTVESGGDTLHAAQTLLPPFRDYVDCVRPWIGSNRGRWFQTVSAIRPFGMIGITPDTELRTRFGGSGYVYKKTDIYGFSHLSGWGLGAILVMPTVGGVSPAGGPDGWKSSHQHADETMAAGYHKVLLERYGITSEITSTARAGFHRWTYANDGVADIFFDLGSSLSEADQANAEAVKVGDSEIEGWVQMRGNYEGDSDDAGKVYFVARFSRPFTSLSAWNNEDRGSVASAAGHPLVVYPRFSVKRGDVLTMKIGISFCDISGARRNLETEIGGKDFETTRRESREEWNNWLGKIQVTGGTDEQRIKFYTDVWHTLFGRLTLNDSDGRYCDRMGDTPVIRQLPMENGRPKHRLFSTDAIWWTMWNLNIWWGMTYPSVIEEWVHDSLLWYDNDPKHRIPWGICNGAHSWVMLGCQRTPLLCGAVQMGMKGIPEQKIYDTLKQMHSSPRRGGNGWMDGLDDYLKLGYIPADGKLFDTCRSASLTVDDSFTDWVLAQLAQKLGRDDDYAELMRRSANWKNLWDGRYIRPRNRDGSWADFDPLVGRNRGYCEANAEQYSFFPVQDVPGVSERMGGFAAYCDRLNADFEEAAKSDFSFGEGQHGGEGQVNYANEPNLQAAHLFNHAGQPWRSQYWARQVQRGAFNQTDGDGGYALGDEDQGQLGAISSLLAVGLFSLRGGCESPPIYEITTPIFDTVTITLDQKYYSGKQFVIKTHNNSAENHYIQSASLNGKPLNNFWIYQSQFAAGGTLELWLGPKPNTGWGITPPPTVGRPPIPVP